jgi:hypothetical protein
VVNWQLRSATWQRIESEQKAGDISAALCQGIRRDQLISSRFEGQIGKDRRPGLAPSRNSGQAPAPPHHDPNALAVPGIANGDRRKRGKWLVRKLGRAGLSAPICFSSMQDKGQLVAHEAFTFQYSAISDKARHGSQYVASQRHRCTDSLHRYHGGPSHFRSVETGFPIQVYIDLL